MCSVLFTEVRGLWDIWGEKGPGEAGATTVALRQEGSSSNWSHSLSECYRKGSRNFPRWGFSIVYFQETFHSARVYFDTLNKLGGSVSPRIWESSGSQAILLHELCVSDSGFISVWTKEMSLRRMKGNWSTCPCLQVPLDTDKQSFANDKAWWKSSSFCLSGF